MPGWDKVTEFFFTLFTRATPFTPASFKLIVIKTALGQLWGNLDQT